MSLHAIVIGSGISGLSISKMLQPGYHVKVLERGEQIGGLIKCARIGGNLFHLVGGHVFNSKNATVLDWFWNHFDRDREFLRATRNARVFFNGETIGYPIENFIYQLPSHHAHAIIADLLAIAAAHIDPAETDSFEDFLKASFGQTLFDLYFGPYNSKIWNTDLAQVPLKWLDGKLPMPDIAGILSSNILRKGEAEMVHSTFFYPVRDGSQFIIDRLAEGLDIETGRGVDSIGLRNGKLSVNGGAFTPDVLVYSGDIRKLHEIISIDDADLKDALLDVRDLVSNGTSNLLCATDANDISWLYLPESKFKAHRIIYTGNFSETNNESPGRKTCVVEFSGKVDPEIMLEELSLLPGNLRAISFNYEPNSYIIHHADTSKLVDVLKRQLEKYNIHLLGRFAEWEYYNMDKCIERAMALSSVLMQTPGNTPAGD